MFGRGVTLLSRSIQNNIEIFMYLLDTLYTVIDKLVKAGGDWSKALSRPFGVSHYLISFPNI